MPKLVPPLTETIAWLQARLGTAGECHLPPDAAFLLPVASMLSHACLAPHALRHALSTTRNDAHRRLR